MHSFRLLFPLYAGITRRYMDYMLACDLFAIHPEDSIHCSMSSASGGSLTERQHNMACRKDS